LGAFRYRQGVTSRKLLVQVGGFFDRTAALDIEVVPTANLVCHALHEDSFLGEDPRVLRVVFEGLHESILQPSGAYNWKNARSLLIFCEPNELD
jgi:hypothetical protein